MKAIVLLLAAVCLVGCSGKHYDESNISELYDRDWIVGRSVDEIEDKYGELDREYTLDSGENVGAYYVNYDNGGIDPSYVHDTYFIVFGDDNTATDAYFAKTSAGG